MSEQFFRSIFDNAQIGISFMALKFADHFLWIARAINQAGPEGMWDEEDGFYYDVLRLPDGSTRRLNVRSMGGSLPLCATTVIEPWQRERVSRVGEVMFERLRRMPELSESIHATGPRSAQSVLNSTAPTSELEQAPNDFRPFGTFASCAGRGYFYSFGWPRQFSD